MHMAGFKMGWTNRRRCKITKRDGASCGRLAMTRYSLSVAARTPGSKSQKRLAARRASRTAPETAVTATILTRLWVAIDSVEDA